MTDHFTNPSFPQEIIHQILSNISTRQLCTLLPTSKSIFLDVTGILHARLETHLVSKGDHKLIVRPLFPLILTRIVRSIPSQRPAQCPISHVYLHPYISGISVLYRLVIQLLFADYPLAKPGIVAWKIPIPYAVKSGLCILSFS
jgi:hypothetical protein